MRFKEARVFRKLFNQQILFKIQTKWSIQIKLTVKIKSTNNSRLINLPISNKLI